MQTSYFKNSALDPTDPRLVSIARWSPRGYRGRHYPPLGTPKHMMKMGEAEFRKAYQEEILDKLNPQEVLEALGPDAILLCWEKPGEFCHRRIVAAWLEEELGILVPEYEVAKQAKLFD